MISQGRRLYLELILGRAGLPVRLLVSKGPCPVDPGGGGRQ